MLDALFSALSGIRASSRKLEASANNVANMQTPGFKKTDAIISDNAIGGAEVTGAATLNAQGSLLTTSNPMDLAVNGNGFFQLSLPNGGTGFTRAGNFKLDNTGQIVTSDGNPLNPPVAIPPGSTSVSIDGQGMVSAQVGGKTVNAGQIQLANFNNPSGLQAAGGNVFLQTGASGQPVTGNPGAGGLGGLVSGAVEGSNVDLGEEMINQVISKVAYTASINVMKTANEMTGALLNLKA